MPEATPYRHLYEVLLRFDGPTILRGAHVQYIEGFAVDGQVISAKLGDALPLSLADKADEPTLAGAIGEAALALLTAKEAAEADATAARAEFKAKDDNIQALIADLEAANTEKGRALRGESSAREEALTLRHETMTLRAQLHGLEPPPPFDEWRATQEPDPA